MRVTVTIEHGEERIEVNAERDIPEMRSMGGR